ncbi:MAG: 4-hydroxybenzoate octaprenyltransferase [Lautropia sp.]|nr:4-hydroxybenzoate octaprenyltransferase [Lautropia sp.]
MSTPQSERNSSAGDSVETPADHRPASLGPAQRLHAYVHLTRLHKPIGILLLIWPTLWALFIAADGWPPLYPLFAFCLGTVLMRSAGCAINDFADRDIDGHVTRTVDRPLARGMIAPWEAVAVFVVLCLLALPLVFPFGPLVWGLSVVAAILAASYPYFKRFFAIPQAYLGIAFGFGIPMAFAALTGTVPLTAWIMLAANVCWTVAYDTEYAMVDRNDDLRLGIRTSAITFGSHDVAAVMACYASAIGLMAWVGVREQLFPGMLVGLSMAAVIALYHWLLIRRRERADCFKAFNHNNWFGAAIFLGVLLGVLTK